MGRSSIELESNEPAKVEAVPPPVSSTGNPDAAVVMPESAAPVDQDSSSWPTIVRALRNPDFRLFWSGNFLSNIGTWMQNIAQGWLVLQLSNSSFWLGVVGFAASIPFLIFTLFGGVIADRVNKRKLLIVTQTAMMLLAFAMALLAYLKIITITQVAVLAFLNGTAMALNAPSYQALVPQLVRRSDLTNAIALNSAQFNMSRVLGPTLGGYAMAVFGVAGNFFLNGLSFLAVLIALFKIEYPEQEKRSKESMLESLREGFRYVRSKPEMEALVLLVASASLLLLPFLTFIPYFAKNTLGTGERGLGFLMACSGIGAFFAAGIVAYVGKMRHRGRIIVLSGMTAMAGVITFCYSHDFRLSACMMFVEGMCMILAVANINVAMQELSSDAMRGRVMSIYATSFLGLPPIGCLVAGELSRHMQTAHAVAAMVAMAMVCFGGFFLYSRALRELD